jgi:hypothetical protein
MKRVCRQSSALQTAAKLSCQINEEPLLLFAEVV